MKEQETEFANPRAVATREEFGVTQETPLAETSATALEARERALIQARFIMAERNQRSVADFRARILHECERTGFAERAQYEKPLGREFNKKTKRWEDKFARGPSVRFVEAALQAFRNNITTVTTTYNTSELRICRCSVSDLESNVHYDTEIVIEKRIERRGSEDEATGKIEPPKGRVILGERINSSGVKTFLVMATDDEVRLRQNALASMAKRNDGLRLLPPDVVAECMEACKKTMASADERDPDAAKKKLLDAFYELDVLPSELAMYLGRADVDRLQPAELAKLRGIYTAIRDGQTTWDEVMLTSGVQGKKGASATVAERKITELSQQQQQQQQQEETRQPQTSPAGPPTEAEMRQGTLDAVAEEARAEGKSASREAFTRRSK